MRDLELGRLVRALRRRRGWRQEDAAVRARVHRSTWSNLERGRLEQMAVETVRRCLAALEVRLDLVPRWRGAELDRLLDQHHAQMQSAWVRRLRAWGWVVRVEVSFNHYGDRGRIDLLAWHPSPRTLLVGEIKTELADVQALLGSLDVKVRVARGIAQELGWDAPALVLPLLVISDTSTNRRRLRSMEPLFESFGLRGKAALGWLHRPSGSPETPRTGLVVLSILSSANPSRVRRHHAASRAAEDRATSVR